MSRSFNGTTDFGENGNGIITATPLTLSAWIYPTNVASIAQTILAFTRKTTTVEYFVVRINANNAVGAVSTNGASVAVASSSATLSNNTWQHACAVFASATDRRAFKDGANKGTNATSVTPGTINTATLACNYNSGSISNVFQGRIAFASAWNVALDDSEVAALGKGMSPLLIRPASIKAYWPLYGNDSPELEYLTNKFNMTLTGTSKAEQPRLYSPFSAR